MDRELAKQAIKECKAEAKLDYAYSQASECCMSCTNAVIASKFGSSSQGLYIKWHRTGMNASRWDEFPKKYICHTLTESQAKKVVEVLSRYFNVEWSGDSNDCIAITGKSEVAS